VELEAEEAKPVAQAVPEVEAEIAEAEAGEAEAVEPEAKEEPEAPAEA
jgi:hypothetical protein